MKSELDGRFILGCLLFSSFMALVMGVVTYKLQNDFWYGFKWGAFWMIAGSVGCIIWLFVIVPIICPETNVKK